jgi:superoxide reductase
MIKENQTYKCALCGNHVKVIAAGGGELVCCGQAMELVSE